MMDIKILQIYHLHQFIGFNLQIQNMPIGGAVSPDQDPDYVTLLVVLGLMFLDGVVVEVQQQD